MYAFVYTKRGTYIEVKDNEFSIAKKWLQNEVVAFDIWFKRDKAWSFVLGYYEVDGKWNFKTYYIYPTDPTKKSNLMQGVYEREISGSILSVESDDSDSPVGISGHENAVRNFWQLRSYIAENQAGEIDLLIAWEKLTQRLINE